ncbi:MAG: roadblock/LC7 domain-containing protein [Deltaproteobacteria bacterium]|nr:roadblock/LC7 domain-containing protein [Deltaproteobacteria bacterium]
MPFKKILKELCDRTGAKGAIMLDWEGEAVDMYSTDANLELAALGAHKGIILNLLKEATQRVDNQAVVEHVGISTSNSRIILHVLKDGYYVLLTMDRDKQLGRAMFETKKASKRLLAEM